MAVAVVYVDIKPCGGGECATGWGVVVVIVADNADSGSFASYGSSCTDLWFVYAVCDGRWRGWNFVVAWTGLADFAIYHDHFLFDLFVVFGNWVF